jgi:hypothetical protein
VALVQIVAQEMAKNLAEEGLMLEFEPERKNDRRSKVRRGSKASKMLGRKAQRK